MKKEEILKLIEEKPDADFVIRTQEEEADYLTNYAAKIEDETVKPAQRKVYDIMDEVVNKVSGIKRGQNEKTSEFYERVLTDFKTKAEKSEAFETEIKSLKKQIEDGTGDKKTLEDLKAMEKAYKELEDTKTKEITDLRTEYDKFKIKAEITSALSGMTFKKNIPESAIKALTDQAISDLTNIAAYQDGKLIFLENGVPKRNAHNGLKEYTARELIEERLKEIRDTGKQSNGGPDLSKEIVKEHDDKGKLSKISILLPDSIKYKDQLSNHLVSIGLLRGTEEYNLAYKEYSPSLEAR